MAVTAGLAEEDKPDWNDGVFLVDKPAGMTSFAIVRRIRRLLGIRKVGHAGTLDPFASGLLIVCVGRPATRQIELFMAGRKTYQARLQLGVETTTLDPEGSVVATRPVPELDEAALIACLQSHVGPRMQAPPPFSAAKHKGKPLYVYARQGVRIEKPAKPIEIFSLELLSYEAGAGQLDIEVECSRGTYIRVVAADIGQALGCGAHLVALRRIRSGRFTVEDGLPGEELFADSGPHLLRSRRLDLAEVVQAAG